MGEEGSVISPELTLESPEKWGFMDLEDCVSRLEDEMSKIQAFKRELPLCMLLVKDEIARLKKKTMINHEKPKSPLKKKECEDDKNCDDCDKTKWMSSVQLWSSGNETEIVDKKRNEEEGTRRREIPLSPLLSLAVSETNLSPNSSSSIRSGGASSATDYSKVQKNQRTPQKQQASRKQRRCWSSELHRRFLNALHHLGGPQAATPKQIRDMMQVEGLTNDEVKSHLQKYRLHTRRGASSQTGVVAASAAAMLSKQQDEEEEDDSSSEIHNQEL